MLVSVWNICRSAVAKGVLPDLLAICDDKSEEYMACRLIPCCASGSCLDPVILEVQKS